MITSVQYYTPEIVHVAHYQSVQAMATNPAMSIVLKPELAPDTRKSDVLSVETDADGRVSFFLPSGEKLFAEKGTYFAPCKDGSADSFRVKQEIELAPEEKIFGFGQVQDGRLNQRGQALDLKNRNMNIAIPFLHSSKGYGILWNNFSPMTFLDNASGTSMDFTNRCVEYFFIYGGNAEGVVRGMRRLTGQVPLLPLWAYGYWQSRERYKTQQDLIDVVAKYRDLGVPLDAIVQDWQYWGDPPHWNAMQFKKETFPDPQGMVDEVHRRHAKIMIVAWPGFGPETAPYREFEQKNMLLNFRTWPPETFAKPYDVYNPAARDIYWGHLDRGVFSLGVDGLWLDSTEPDHIQIKDKDYDVPTHLGTFRSVHNAFPLAHVAGISEHWRKTCPAKRVVLLTRSASAGQQRCGSVTWSGDIQSTWEALARQIPAALGFSLSGNPNWNADIGGFFAGRFKGAKDPAFQELYRRWTQFACFTTMMRSHGTNHPREIYQFGKRGETTFDIIEKYIRLRYALLPYIYSMAWDVTRHGGSFMRPLCMDYPTEAALQEIGDEYLFGRSLLVAPVVHAKATSRRVVLPPGGWVDYWTNEHVPGGQTIDRPVPDDIIPLYVKAGTILPIGPDVQYATEKPWDCLTLVIYPGADGTFTLFEDTGDGYDYERGLYSEIAMSWDDARGMLTIGPRKGDFPGMLKDRLFRVMRAGTHPATAKGAGGLRSADIRYTGETVTVRMAD